MPFNWQDLVLPGLGLAGQLWGQNQTQGTANQYFGMGQPYRDQLAAITADPNLYYNSPQAQALADASDRRYSVYGNPAGSGTSQAGTLQAMLRGYNDERRLLGNLGGLGGFNAAAPGAQGNATNAGMGVFNALGPLASIFLGGGGGGMGLGNVSGWGTDQVPTDYGGLSGGEFF